MRIHYILHADFELPAILEVWAKARGFSQSRSRPFAREKLPARASFDLLVVMGGPQSAYEFEKAPYLLAEVELIKEACAAGIPVLGFCLGAQLIGAALGAPAEKSPEREVGVFPIELTQEGLDDPLLKGLPKEFEVVHWHNAMPGLTPEAQLLAKSQGCPRQIIRYRPNVYGFQCHLELMKLNMEMMVGHCPDDLAPGKFVQSAERLLASDFARINAAMIEILENFLMTIHEQEASSLQSH
jgi:GMP synthase (glutamine-hydrolysing)